MLTFKRKVRNPFFGQWDSTRNINGLRISGTCVHFCSSGDKFTSKLKAKARSLLASDLNEVLSRFDVAFLMHNGIMG